MPDDDKNIELVHLQELNKFTIRIYFNENELCEFSSFVFVSLPKAGVIILDGIASNIVEAVPPGIDHVASLLTKTQSIVSVHQFLTQIAQLKIWTGFC